MARPNPRLEGWHFFALGTSTSATVLKLRSWCKENLEGPFKIERQTVSSNFFEGLQVCIGVVVWAKEDDDFFLLKLRWSNYE